MINQYIQVIFNTLEKPIIIYQTTLYNIFKFTHVDQVRFIIKCILANLNVGLAKDYRYSVSIYYIVYSSSKVKCWRFDLYI